MAKIGGRERDKIRGEIDDHSWREQQYEVLIMYLFKSAVGVFVQVSAFPDFFEEKPLVFRFIVFVFSFLFSKLCSFSTSFFSKCLNMFTLGNVRLFLR